MRISAKQHDDRDPRGRFVPGNQTARRAKGSPKTVKREVGRIARETALETRRESLAAARIHIVGAMPNVVVKLREQALAGDIAAANTLLRYGLPLSSSETIVTGCEDIAQLHAEDRIKKINQRIAMGELPIEHGRMLIDAAKGEIEAELLTPLRRLLRDLKRGTDITDAVRRLANLTDQIDRSPTLIEQSADDGLHGRLHAGETTDV